MHFLKVAFGWLAAWALVESLQRRRRLSFHPDTWYRQSTEPLQVRDAGALTAAIHGGSGGYVWEVVWSPSGEDEEDQIRAKGFVPDVRLGWRRRLAHEVARAHGRVLQDLMDELTVQAAQASRDEREVREAA